MTTLYPPAAVPTFPAGFPPAPANFDSWVQATLGFCTNNVLFRAEQHTGQAIPATTFTPVQYDTILEDPAGAWSPTTFRWLAPYTGWYNVTVSNIIVAANLGLAAAVGVDGASHQVALTSQSTNAGGANGAYCTSLVAGTDYIQGIVWASNTCTLDTSAGRYSSIEITYSAE